MITAPATAQDFARWEKQARSYTDSELVFAIDDCIAAADAMATHPGPNREGYYRDQASTFRAELTRRQEIAFHAKKKIVYVAMVPCVTDNNDKSPAVASLSCVKIERYLCGLPQDTCKNSHILNIELI